MPLRTFRIVGQVTDENTKKGVPGLRVEAWNRDGTDHAVLGSGSTDEQGHFAIAASADPAGAVGGLLPAVLKVLDGDKSLPTTGPSAIPDLFSQSSLISLQVQMPVHETERVDRISVPQLLSAVDFIRLSDFSGIFQEGKDRTFAAGNLFIDTLKRTLSQIELEPLQAPSVRNRDVLYQDPTTATQRLGAQGIAVEEVKPYRKDFESFGTIPSLAANLKKGDRVQLYEEDGVVKAYGVARSSKRVDPGTVNQIGDNLKKVQAEATTNTAAVNQMGDDLKKVQAAADANVTAVNQMADSLKKMRADSEANTVAVKQIGDNLKKVQADADARTTAMTQMTNDLRKMQTDASASARQVDDLRAQLAQRDATIADLRGELGRVQKSFTDLTAQQVKPERLAAIEEALRKLQAPR